MGLDPLPPQTATFYKELRLYVSIALHLQWIFAGRTYHYSRWTWLQKSAITTAAGLHSFLYSLSPDLLPFKASYLFCYSFSLSSTFSFFHPE
jgi:hypothetical protein